MPNWCSTSINIITTAENANKVWAELEEASKLDYSDWHGNWLGNLLCHIGMSLDEVCHGDVRCRGEITYRDLVLCGDNSIITLDTETAWMPHMRCIRMFLDHYIPEAYRIEYVAMELDCGLYWANSIDPTEEVYIDVYNEEKLPDCLKWLGDKDCYANHEDLRQRLSEALGEDGTLEELASKAEELVWETTEPYSDVYLKILPFEYIPVEELE